MTVVIPSLRGGADLVRLVEALTPAPGSPRVLIADNGLSSAARIALGSTRAELVDMGGNLGFGRAVNRAAAVADSDVLAVLNDDIAPAEGFLEALVAPIAEGATMVSGVLLQERRPEVIETAGVVLDRTLMALDHLQNQPVARLEASHPAPFGPTGGAAAYRLDAFRAVGGFDERLFAYFEDVDLAIRLRARGARCVLAADARALHAGSGTLGYRSLAKANLVGFSRGYLLRKYGVLSGRGAPAALAGEIAAVVMQARRHRSLAPARARISGWRSCDARGTPPPRQDLQVALVDTWRRRFARGRLVAAPDTAPAATGGEAAYRTGR